MVSEIYTKQSINEENSSLFMKSILQTGKNEGRNLKLEKYQIREISILFPETYVNKIVLSWIPSQDCNG